MGSYRLYLLDGAGRIQRTLEQHFDTEEEAAIWARDVAHEHGKELRQSRRLVLCFTSRGEAWRPHMSAAS